MGRRRRILEVSLLDNVNNSNDFFVLFGFCFTLLLVCFVGFGIVCFPDGLMSTVSSSYEIRNVSQVNSQML